MFAIKMDKLNKNAKEARANNSEREAKSGEKS